MTSPAIIDLHIKKEYAGLSLINTIRKDPLGYFLNVAVKEGPYAWFSLAGDPVLLLNDAKAIEYIFSENYKNYHKGKYNDGLRPLLGNSVFLSEDDLWMKQRRNAAPNFSGGNFPEYAKRIDEAVDAMLANWDERLKTSDIIDINAETLRLALDVVLRALYHEDSEEALEQVKECLATMLKFAEHRIWSLFNLPVKVAIKMAPYAKTLKFLDSLTFELIDRRRHNQQYPEDLLSTLIRTHGQTAEELKLLRDGVLSFLLAGHETTANAMAWTFFELGKNTYAREKLEAEVASVVGDAAHIDMEMIKNLHYTKQAFSEGLRLYPSIWAMSRQTLTDDILPLEDGRQLRVPKGATVMLCTYTVHRREKYWRDPESFTPERFTQEEINARPKCAWFPFGGGPRLCLGFKFAEVEAAIMMAKVYQRYDLSLVPGLQIKPEPIITLRPDRPLLFRVKRKSSIS